MVKRRKASRLNSTRAKHQLRRSSRALEFIKRLREGFFQERLSESDRDRRIAWIVQTVKSRIDQIVGGKWQEAYADEAHDAKLITELYYF